MHKFGQSQFFLPPVEMSTPIQSKNPFNPAATTASCGEILCEEGLEAQFGKSAGRRSSEPNNINSQFIDHVRVIKDYISSPYDTEWLTIKVGDEIDVIDKPQTGEWTGILAGRRGKFKFNFVQPIRKENVIEKLPIETLLELLGLTVVLPALAFSQIRTMKDLATLEEKFILSLGLSEERRIALDVCVKVIRYLTEVASDMIRDSGCYCAEPDINSRSSREEILNEEDVSDCNNKFICLDMFDQLSDPNEQIQCDCRQSEIDDKGTEDGTASEDENLDDEVFHYASTENSEPAREIKDGVQVNHYSNEDIEMCMQTTREQKNFWKTLTEKDEQSRLQGSFSERNIRNEDTSREANEVKKRSVERVCNVTESKATTLPWANRLLHCTDAHKRNSTVSALDTLGPSNEENVNTPGHLNEEVKLESQMSKNIPESSSGHNRKTQNHVTRTNSKLIVARPAFLKQDQRTVELNEAVEAKVKAENVDLTTGIFWKGGLSQINPAFISRYVTELDKRWSYREVAATLERIQDNQLQQRSFKGTTSKAVTANSESVTAKSESVTANSESVTANSESALTD